MVTNIQKAKWYAKENGLEFAYVMTMSETFFESIEIPQNDLDILLREEFKSERQLLVDQIKVTTDAGNTFDGNEVSQGRMARFLIRAQPDETITWILADNSAIEATASEITEALRLSVRAQEAVWVPL